MIPKIQFTHEQARELLSKAYQIQFEKETELRRLRLLDHRDDVRDPGAPVLHDFDPATCKTGVMRLLKEIHKHGAWLDEEIRDQQLINADANLSQEILSLVLAIGVEYEF